MTDQASVDLPAPAPAASSANADQLQRLANIRRRRAEVAGDRSANHGGQAAAGPAAPGKQRSKRRRHVAQGGRILAAGLGATTMFGIVTVLGLDNPVSGAETSTPTTPVVQPVAPAPVVVPPPPIQIVIHRVPAVTNLPVGAESARLTASPKQAAEAPVSAAPAAVQLTANPVVQTITVAAPAQSQSQASQAPASQQAPAPAPAPAATTNGSN
ncbi:MAG: hypothetical protein ACI83Y_002153 [Candidatus Azotimanducaceae bacterium]|jgi:hypothetical protein